MKNININLNTSLIDINAAYLNLVLDKRGYTYKSLVTLSGNIVFLRTMVLEK